MRILISGSHGLIGSALADRFKAAGHQLVRLVRGEARREQGEVWWEPAAGRLDAAALGGLDAVVHLAGENIAGRWTSAKKQRILASRVDGTRLLSQALAGLPSPPTVFASASAIGYYGNRGDEVLSEDSAGGAGFLADVCRQWEAATKPAHDAGIRVVQMRMGIVLTRAGGVLGQVLPMFRAGLGGRLGDGRQYVSWISLVDLVPAIDMCLRDASLEGPVNLTAPTPVTNAEFAEALGRVLHRPTLLPVPAFVLRTALGEAADALPLCSARVLPQRLNTAGFKFQEPLVEPALRRMLDPKV